MTPRYRGGRPLDEPDAVGTLYVAEDGTAYRLLRFRLGDDLEDDHTRPVYGTSSLEGGYGLAYSLPDGAEKVWVP